VVVSTSIVFCEPSSGDDFVTTYRTYRFVGGKWKATSREVKEFWEAEGEFPGSRAFP
jgi:hypothetical protein